MASKGIPQSPADLKRQKEEEKYKSPLDLPSFILIFSFALMADFFNLATVYFFFISTIFTLVLRLVFLLMHIENPIVNKFFIGFASCSVYVALVYVSEKVKESSPEAAKVMGADGLANSVSGAKK